MGGRNGEGGDGGGESTRHEPSSTVANESKLAAIGAIQPKTEYMQQSAHAVFASEAKFLALLSVQPVIMYMHASPTEGVVVAIESKLSALAAVQPKMSYLHVPSSVFAERT